MGMMNVEVPEGATIQVFVGKEPLIGASGMMVEASPPAVARHKSHPVATTLAAIVILGGGFLLGQHMRLSPSANAASSASVASPPPVTQAFPERAPVAVPHLPEPSASPSAPEPHSPEVPSDFTTQLQRKPTVVPPPGQASSAPHKNPFGLGD